MTTAELAEKYGVSLRTVRYDVEILSRVYPIETRAGKGGGVQVADWYQPTCRLPAEHIVDYSSSYSALVDGKGNYIIAPGKYDSISWYESAGLYTIKLNKQYGLMDKGGKIVVYPFYDSIALSANLYRIKKAGMYGYIDRSGNALIPYIYSNARDFSNGYAAVKDADGWHIMDASGNFVH